jgi:site-specific DNA-cytosine methylase
VVLEGLSSKGFDRKMMDRKMNGILRAADLFCGAGGTSTGAEMSGRVKVVLAVNCWPTAIASHKANHPHAMHVCKRIDHVDPRQDKSLPEFDLLMASPECVHHSIARGGRPIDDQRRCTPWDVLNWVSARRPRWLVLENVREFRDWGPLDAKCRPIASRKGEIFKAWLAALQSVGYQVDVQLLNAADYGAATKRTRLFVIARRGYSRRDIRWPQATHSKAQWRPAWSIIDWQKPCPSIFSRIGFRMLDVDELARAQGFPDGYILTGNKADRVKQIGNSVPPPVARAIAGSKHEGHKGHEREKMSVNTKRRRQKLTFEQQAAHDAKILEYFNRAFPVGATVWFWKTLPFGPVQETSVRGEAFWADSGEPVCFLKGISGYVSIWHVQSVDESGRGDLTFV